MKIFRYIAVILLVTCGTAGGDGSGTQNTEGENAGTHISCPDQGLCELYGSGTQNTEGEKAVSYVNCPPGQTCTVSIYSTTRE